MIVSDYVVRICHQTLVTDKRAKDTPYIYRVEEPDLKELDLPTIEVLERGAQSILDRLSKERQRRSNEFPQS